MKISYGNGIAEPLVTAMVLHFQFSDQVVPCLGLYENSEAIQYTLEVSKLYTKDLRRNFGVEPSGLHISKTPK